MDPIEAALRNLILLQRISNGLSADAAARLRELFDAIVAELARIDPVGPTRDSARRRRLERLLDEIGEIADRRFAEIARQLRQDLARVGVQQAGWATDQLRRSGVTARITPGVPGVNRMKAILDSEPIQGQLLSDWFDGETEATRRAVARQLRLGMAQGETLGQLVRRIRGRQVGRGRFEGGVLSASRRHVEAIVRTSVTHVANDAHIRTYRESGATREYEYVATLDNRTTLICISLDGRVFRYDDPQAKRPPQHVNCRSTIRPIVRGVDVPRQSYEDWLKEQPSAKQNEILGRGRAELWRAGKISLRDLIRTDGGIVTLDELAGEDEAA